MHNRPANPSWRFLVRMGGTGLFCLHLGVVLLTMVAPVTMVVHSVAWASGQPGGPWRFFAEAVPRWCQLLGNSGRVALPAILIAVGLGSVVAIVLFKTNAIGRAPASALLLLAAMFPLYVTGGAMLGVFRRDHWLESTMLAGAVHGFAHLPIATLLIGLALRLIPDEYEELAMLEGAGTCRTVRRVSLRMARPAVLGAILLVTLWTWTDYSITDILAVRTFAEEVYTQYALHPHSYESVMIMWPQLLLFGAMMWLFRGELLDGRWHETTYSSGRKFGLGFWRVPASIAMGAAVLACVFAPICFLGARVKHLGEVGQMLRLFAPEIRVSAITSVLAGIVCALLAVGLAWWARKGRFWRAVVGVYVVFMLAFPAPVLGIGLISVFNRNGWVGEVYDSPLMLVVAYVTRFLPLAVILMIPSIRAIPSECELAAQVDGSAAARIWWSIIWPACWPAAVGVAFVVIVLSLGELPCSLLVTPPGYVTVTARFFSLIHYGLYADSAALCLLSMAAVAVPWAGLLFLLRRKYMG